MQFLTNRVNTVLWQKSLRPKKRHRRFYYLINNNKSLFQYQKYESETEKMNAPLEETLYSQLLVQHATERSCELLAKTETIPGNDTNDTKHRR